MRFFKFNRTLVKETFVYTATDAIGKGVSFIILPIVSYYILPDEMGIVTNFSVLTTIITLLAGQAVVNSLPFFFYEQTKEENRSFVSNLLLICTTLCVTSLLFVLFFHSLIESYLQISLKIQLLSVIAVIAGLVNSLSFIILRLENKSFTFAKVQITQIVLHAVLVVLLVIVLGFGGFGKILSEVFASLLIAGFNLFSLFRKGYLCFEVKKDVIERLLKFGLPLLPHSLSFWLKSGMDKVFITTYCGLYQNGIYSTAVTITSLYSLVTHSFFSAYTPYLQKRLSLMTEENEKDEKLRLVKLTYLLMAAFFIVALLAIFAAWVILFYIYDNKYEEAFQFVPGLILGLYIYAIYSFTIQFIYKKKKTLVMGIITFTGSIVQMLFSYYCVSHYGTVGAVWSSILGSTLVSIAIFVYSNKVYPMPWLGFLRLKKK